MQLIGREKEKKILTQVLQSKESEFVALYGRRRVGKTFLVDTFYKNEIVFSITGMNKTELSIQLENFKNVLNRRLEINKQIDAVPKSWLEAFELLKIYVASLTPKNKMVIFIDELPWLATRKSGFLPALEIFWNDWASKRSDIILLVCGSAASWMISNIVKNTGGLYNRITKRIRLSPFSLQEVEAFLKARNIYLERYDILQLYMIMGGIPHYLKSVEKGKSVTQIIDELCFTKDGILRDEFQNLYEALFNKPERYINIVKILAAHPKGLTRNELIKLAKLSSGGTTSRILDGLEESDFIVRYLPIGSNLKLSLYKLSDPYSAFYLKFIGNTRAKGKGTWIKKAEKASWKSWSGFAFERLCLSHSIQIKKAIGIQSVYTEEASWHKKGTNTDKGAQIDLLIDRADNVINICEIKFFQDLFTIDKSYAEKLRNKLTVFKKDTKTKKTLFLTMITTYGVKENQYSISLVQQSIKMDSLFET